MPSDQTRAVSYSRVSSDRQDVELSVSGQKRAIREWAERNGYVVVREYVDEAESGRIDTRDGFSQMIRDACVPNPHSRRSWSGNMTVLADAGNTPFCTRPASGIMASGWCRSQNLPTTLQAEGSWKA